MNAREMHYEFKTRINKIDSQKFRGLVVPEIDIKLNEAQEIFVKIIAQPRLANQLGFEVNQRTIDDIRTIVINQKESDGQPLTVFENSSFIGSLPDNYWFFANAKVLAAKAPCPAKKLSIREVQHDDDAEASPFDRSSFEWNIVNIRFINEGIRVFTDGTFTPSKIMLEYLKQPRRIHNAQDWEGGTYTTLDDEVLTGTQSCELPTMVHSEVVDLAVLITANDLALSTYQLKRDKLNITK